ncbi:uncharacterized protein LOC107304482 isoform X1 [Oryza brachyantha]|uniref:uncharacterized protein LOC107304482 isoform X1 n=1 Tax=Oryza brachyantha TaxID=4533 RepID=UPI0007760E54|nr:uncharacterized protein LOC107304482 isoform X1 [Oryza brachyantha]
MVISAIACHGWEEEATFCFCLGGHASLKKMTKAFFRITFVEHGKGVDHARKEQLLKNRAFLQGTLLLLVAVKVCMRLIGSKWSFKIMVRLGERGLGGYPPFLARGVYFWSSVWVMYTSA